MKFIFSHKTPSAAMALALAACSQMDKSVDGLSDGSIRLGLIAPRSGHQANLGRSIEAGAKLARREINARGGILGRSLDFIVRDDQCSSDYSPTDIQQILSLDAVGAVASICSGSTVALTQVSIPARLPVISGGTSPALTGLSDDGLLFRTAPSDVFQSRILASKIRALGLTSMSVIYIDNVYGQGLAAAFKTAFEQGGGHSVLAQVNYDESKSSDFGSEIDRLFANGEPQGLLLITYVVDGANITRDLKVKRAGALPRIFGCDGNYDADFLASSEPTVIEGMLGTTPQAPLDSPNYQAFAAAMRQATGRDPGPYADVYYDAVYLFAYALGAAGGTDPDLLKTQITAVSKGDGTANTMTINVGDYAQGLAAIKGGKPINYEGASGVIDLDAAGDPSSGTYGWWKVVNGQYVTQETITYP